MTSINTIFKYLCILVACCSVATAQAQSAPQIQLNKQDKSPVSVLYNEGDRPDAAQATSVIASLLKLNNVTEDFVLQHTTKAPLATTLRYNQYYKGIKVAHGVYTAMVKNNRITLLTGNYIRPQYNENTTPVLTETLSLKKAMEAVPAKKYMWQNAAMEQLLKKTTHKADTSYYPKGSLVWCEDFSKGTGDRRLHLAYVFTVYMADPLNTFEVFIDAVTGNVLLKNALTHQVTATGGSRYSGNVSFETSANSTSPGGYVLEDYTRGGGVFTVSVHNTTSTSTLFDITNPNTVWPVSHAIDAHWGVEKVYDYWAQKQGRNSYDDMGTNLVNVVDYDVDYDNAFWNGAAMFYGSGSGIANGGGRPYTSLDVCAHEIGHGVTQETANLIYSGESGALNEGFSDIWGAVIENFANPHEVDSTAKNPWTIGEEIEVTPFRSMKEPKIYGNPDTYNGLYWTPVNNCVSTNDYCGVHNNSGVLNHWFYLLVNGGSGVNDLSNSFGVAGTNIDSAAAIAYYTELMLFPSASYADTRTATISVANSLFGACSKYVESVTRAWYAVGVGADFTPCTPSISFSSAAISIPEYVADTACLAGKTINIPIKIAGPALTGGNATATATVVGGNAVSGVDYVLNTSSVTFSIGSVNTVQNITMTVYDNGSVTANKNIVLKLTVAANGSNAVKANVLDTVTITLLNNDKAPIAGGVETHVITNAGTVGNNLTSPFPGSNAAARIQYVFAPQELVAAGLRANMPVTGLAINVLNKFSTQPFLGYNIRMGNTNQLSFVSSFTNATTLVYSAASLSTVVGWNNLSFSNNFTWDGVSGVVVEICFSGTAPVAANNDVTEGYTSLGTGTAYNNSGTATPGCTLPFDPSLINSAKPKFRFTQQVTPTSIESAVAASRSWRIAPADSVYFYGSADSALIAAIVAPAASISCTKAQVTQSGNGFVPVTYSWGNRSLKEFRLIPAAGNSTVTYTGIFYFKNTELAGLNLLTPGILRTTAATDAAITTGNSVLVPATVITGSNYTGFKGSFNSFGRFFIVDRNNPLDINNSLAASPQSIIISNPVKDQLIINYSFDKATASTIRLYDISGRVVYQSLIQLQEGSHTETINVSGLSLAAGQYFLQLVMPQTVYSQKLTVL